jgi:hypothetical protein
MPERNTIERAKRDLRAGKRPSTAAGEFVREEMEHIRRGRHGARSTRQAIAIGLSQARRAGVPLEAPERAEAKDRTRKSAERDFEAGQGSGPMSSDSRQRGARSHTRSKASSAALKREGRSAASRRALAARAKQTASRRTRRSRAQ